MPYPSCLGLPWTARPGRIRAVALLLALAVAAGTGHASAETRYALVVGNAQYAAVPSLRNPVADARAMRRQLEAAGFSVTYREDADRRAMNRAVDEFVGKLSTDSVAVFYYAGHGVQIGSANYLIPTDIRADTAGDVADDALDLGRVLERVTAAQARFALAIIDACRDNPFAAATGRALGTSRGLAPTTTANGVMVVYSAGANQTALDRLSDRDTNPNGVFTREWLQAMGLPGIPVQAVATQVRQSVASLARSVGHVQVPAVYDQSLGTFEFVPGLLAGTLRARTGSGAGWPPGTCPGVCPGTCPGACPGDPSRSQAGAPCPGAAVVWKAAGARVRAHPSRRSAAGTGLRPPRAAAAAEHGTGFSLRGRHLARRPGRVRRPGRLLPGNAGLAGRAALRRLRGAGRRQGRRCARSGAALPHRGPEGQRDRAIRPRRLDHGWRDGPRAGRARGGMALPHGRRPGLSAGAGQPGRPVPAGCRRGAARRPRGGAPVAGRRGAGQRGRADQPGDHVRGRPRRRAEFGGGGPHVPPGGRAGRRAGTEIPAEPRLLPVVERIPTIALPRHGLAPPRWPEAPSGLPPWTRQSPRRHVHLIWSMALGGAERIVADLARRLGWTGAEADILVLRDAPAEHPIGGGGIQVHRLGALPQAERLAYAAGVIRASRLPAYCHLLSLPELERLWALGCRTVPVFHNAPQGWKPDPAGLDVPAVPFVAACGDAVARALEGAGLRKPVRVLRHVVDVPAPMDAAQRTALRAALGASAGDLLIGMVGRLVPQKDYRKAVTILAELRRRGRPVRLAIVGGAPGAEGAAERLEVDAEARQLGVRDVLVVPGPVADAARLLGAFDVFLNTSRYEGVPVATMEAVAAGVPVVCADVGGQAEAVTEWDTLLPADALPTQWADAVEAAAARVGGVRVEAQPDTRTPLAAAHAWPWLLALGPGADAGPCRTDALFVTGNLDAGGAQRSLCNLAAELAPRGVSFAVAVAGPVGVPGFMAAARRAGAEFIDVSEGAGPSGGLHGRAGRILSLVAERRPRWLVFWNMDAATKLLAAKALHSGPVRLMDVSPGPMLYAELDAEARFGRTLTMDPDRYIAALDVLVAKYGGGGPPAGRGQPRAVRVIPNGVPPAGAPLPAGTGPAPPPLADPALAVVTVGRLAPAKRPGLMPLVARALDRLLPGATLTVVGGLHEGADDGTWTAILAAAGGVLPCNLHFAGPDSRTGGFLARFACFLMVSTGQGCPNASLEAMTAGLPVVANPDGGTAEQVLDGVTGRLVPDRADAAEHAEALAQALADVLRDPVLARRMGEAGRARAARHFSMAAMADGYLSILTT